MVAGDVVNGISALNTILTFQPAAASEVMITYVTRFGATIAFGLFDGVIWTWTSPSASNTGTLNMKMFITNSLYLKIDSTAGGYTSYSGIQIK